VRDGNFLEGLAAGLLAVELAIPERYLKIGQALKNFFQVPHEALEFLWLHAGDPTRQGDYGGDVQHAEEATTLIKKYATTAGMQDRLRLALWRSLEARKVYQWGLYRACVLQHDPQFASLYPESM
jgi:pyrroloquinoline quinone (PQQ) biosynthesis protein C